ncbi:UNVERIFIED_CONTAM: hypothetical protein FKN15_053606 [Acipenser sinensis]
MAESFPYRTKALFAFEEIDGADVCFFGMHVQEYGSDAPSPNQSEGDDYIFHCHPADQKIPKPKRLQEWYKKMLDKAVSERIVHDYKVNKGDSKNAKKKNNKKTSKNKSSLSRAIKKKPGMPNVSNDLSQKLYATMEKHKEVPAAAGTTAPSMPPHLRQGRGMLGAVVLEL